MPQEGPWSPLFQLLRMRPNIEKIFTRPLDLLPTWPISSCDRGLGQSETYRGRGGMQRQLLSNPILEASRDLWAISQSCLIHSMPVSPGIGHLGASGDFCTNRVPIEGVPHQDPCYHRIT